MTETTTLPDELWKVPEDPYGPGDLYRSSLTTAMLETWLRDRGLGDQVAVVEGPDIPNGPGSMVVVSWLPGTGFSLEQVLDTPGFQLRVIGPQSNLPAARELAERIDLELVARDRWPGFIGGRWVVEVRRAGGRPSHDRTDTGNRAHYVCTYHADVEAQ